MSKFRDAAIVGIGQTASTAIPERTAMSFWAEAAKQAVEDSGMAKEEIDGLIVIPSLVEPDLLCNLSFKDYFGLPTLRYTTQPGVAGANGCQAVYHAAMAVTHGLAEAVLIVAGDPTLSGRPPGAVYASVDQWDGPYGAFAPSQYALAARRHMHEFGTTKEQMAEVSVACRRHASLNPLAMMREPITIDDVLNSKPIAEPFNLLDCCIVSDGGGAMLITSAERARDCRKKPVWVLGAGEGHSHGRVWLAPSLSSAGAKESGQTAFGMAGVTPNDVDVAEIYDCFSITPIVILEDLGFCAKGEGGAFVQGGRIQLGGELPLNTHGGLLSHGQPGMCGGFFHPIEATIQVRGEAGERQVAGARIAVAHGNGGILGTECTIILAAD